MKLNFVLETRDTSSQMKKKKTEFNNLKRILTVLTATVDNPASHVLLADVSVFLK